MTEEFTFEVKSEAEALRICAQRGLQLHRISPLPSLHEHRHEMQGRFYALASQDPLAKLDRMAHAPAQCPAHGCGVLIDGEEPHAVGCPWWEARLKEMESA